MVIKKGFQIIQLDGRALFLLTFLITTSLLNSGIGKLERYFYGIKPGVKIETHLVEGLLPDEARLVVEELAIKNMSLPVEPTLDKLTGEVIREKEGVIVDVKKSVEKVIAAKENEQVKLYMVKITPHHSSQDLINANKVLAHYATYIGSSYQRYNNILLAAQGINNVVLWPQDLFSFNEIVGPRTIERGYLPAPVIISGASGTDYGGGVCQVSSTLYNAVLESDLEVIERHPHSKPVSYIPENKDATVSFGDLDFKFKNTSSGVIIVKAGISGGRVWVEVRGKT